MPTFCRKLQVASFYSSLIQPYTKLCHRQNSDRQTNILMKYSIRYILDQLRYIFLSRKKICAQLSLKSMYVHFCNASPAHPFGGGAHFPRRRHQRAHRPPLRGAVCAALRRHGGLRAHRGAAHTPRYVFYYYCCLEPSTEPLGSFKRAIIKTAYLNTKYLK